MAHVVQLGEEVKSSINVLDIPSRRLSHRGLFAQGLPQYSTKTVRAFWQEGSVGKTAASSRPVSEVLQKVALGEGYMTRWAFGMQDA